MSEKKPSEGTGNCVDLENKNKDKIEKPKKWQVVLYNDDYTPMDFVVEILVNVFRHDRSSAYYVMMKVHSEGKGIAGVYSKEIAVTKANKATDAANYLGFPFLAQAEET
jgi:ATP-dependent Clp protease adaptor protein ClpS